MRVPIFIKTPNPNTQNECNQKITVWDEYETYEFCDTVSYNISCSDRERTFRVSYSTTSTRVKVIFLMQFYVPYTSSGFTVNCGIADSNLLPMGTTSRPLITEETTEMIVVIDEREEDNVTVITDPSGSSNSSLTPDDAGETGSNQSTSSWKLPIIIGMACLSFLIMVVVILILCIRFRGEPDEKDNISDSGSDSKSNFTFITEVYIDGNSKSKLVMGKNPAN